VCSSGSGSQERRAAAGGLHLLRPLYTLRDGGADCFLSDRGPVVWPLRYHGRRSVGARGRAQVGHLQGEIKSTRLQIIRSSVG